MLSSLRRNLQYRETSQETFILTIQKGGLLTSMMLVSEMINLPVHVLGY